MQYSIITIKSVKTEGLGELSFFEGDKTIPFSIKRIYYIHHAPEGAIRGAHAHKTLKQLIFCPYGSVSLFLNDGNDEEEIVLDDPSIGVVVMPGLWRDMKWNKSDSVLCVAASDYYDENDYIRNYEQYLSYLNKRDGESK